MSVSLKVSVSSSCLTHSLTQNWREKKSSSSVFVCVMMSSSWEIQLMETAKEELEILQAQYPNRFAYLKSDLQSFISNLREDHAPPSRASSSPLVLTQESSNCKNKEKHKKRKYTNELFGDQASSSTGKIHKNNSHKMAQRVVTKRKTRVEMVLERAQICLQKIRDVKASLC